MNADDNREALYELADAGLGGSHDDAASVTDHLLANRDAVLRALVPEHPDDLSLSDLLCDAQDRAEAAERKVARYESLIGEAIHLCVNGERAPGGNETWPEWVRKAEVEVRGDPAALADEVDDSSFESSAQTTGHAGSQEGDR